MRVSLMRFGFSWEETSRLTLWQANLLLDQGTQTQSQAPARDTDPRKTGDKFIPLFD